MHNLQRWFSHAVTERSTYSPPLPPVRYRIISPAQRSSSTVNAKNGWVGYASKPSGLNQGSGLARAELAEDSRWVFYTIIHVMNLYWRILSALEPFPLELVL